MRFNEKIQSLRKERNWSQEELATRLNVTRQAVSKWESGQSLPDVQTIVVLSEVFEVTTDYLLKEKSKKTETAENADQTTGSGSEEEPEEEIKEEGASTSEKPEGQTSRIEDMVNAIHEKITTPPLQLKLEKEAAVGINESNEHKIDLLACERYLHIRTKIAWMTTLGVFLCILSPVTLIFLGSLSTYTIMFFPGFGLGGEEFAISIGLIVLLCFVAAAVVLFLQSSFTFKPWSWIEKEPFVLEEPAKELAQKEYGSFQLYYRSGIIIGVVLCILSVVPLLIGVHFNASLMVCPMLIMVALGVALFTFVSMVKSGYEQILQIGEYSLSQKAVKTWSSYYWSVVTILYLGVSFLFDMWASSWLIWIAAGVLHDPFMNWIASMKK